MPTLTIRKISDDLHDYLRQRAARQGRSMEAEVRAMLGAAMAEDSRKPGQVVRSIRQRFALVEPGEALEQPQRPPPGQPPGFRK